MSAWSTTPPTRPGYYQITHRKNRSTRIVDVRLYDHPDDEPYLWVALPGGDARKVDALPWIWGPRVHLVAVPTPEEIHQGDFK